MNVNLIALYNLIKLQEKYQSLGTDIVHQNDQDNCPIILLKNMPEICGKQSNIAYDNGYTRKVKSFIISFVIVK